jgi:hypothetical protein
MIREEWAILKQITPPLKNIFIFIKILSPGILFHPTYKLTSKIKNYNFSFHFKIKKEELESKNSLCKIFYKNLENK